MSDLRAADIRVRRVTHWQPTWMGAEPGQQGTYTIQLILDEGAAEAVLQVNEPDADNLFDWLIASSEVYYDFERKALLFGTRPTGG